MKKIKLFGDLQAFRADWELDVRTPAEALRAIEANRPGFLKAADSGEYVAILIDQENSDNTRQVTMDNTSAPWSDELLVIVPRANGNDPISSMVVAAYAAIGITTTATSLLVAATVMVINIGISLAISALANMITGKKQSVSARDTETYESKPSFISNGPVNVVRAGHPYPIIAGRFLCGSIVLSAQIHVKDIPV